MVSAKDLSAIPLLDGLTQTHLEGLSALATRANYSRGDLIFAEGDPASGVHIVWRGRVKVYKLSPDGKEQILHVWKSGEPFGEVAAFQGGVFPAYAEALDECETIQIPRTGLVELIRRDSDFALSWLAVLSSRLRNLATLLETISLKEVPCRLATLFLLLDDQQGGRGRIQLEVSKGELAGQLGTIPETISRTLARMTREGMIKADGPRDFRILDRAGLQELALDRRRSTPAGS